MICYLYSLYYICTSHRIDDTYWHEEYNHVLSGDESFIRVRVVIFRRFRPNDIRRTDDEKDHPSRRPTIWTLQAKMDRQPLQSGVWYIYAGVGRGPDKSSDCYDEWHVSTYPGNSVFTFVIPVVKSPLEVFDLLFFAVFGQTQTRDVRVHNWDRTQPLWTAVPFKFFFGIYLLVSVVVLINLLIAMMTDTYQRIQVKRSYALFRCSCTSLLSVSFHIHEEMAQALLGWITKTSKIYGSGIALYFFIVKGLERYHTILIFKMR